MSYFDEILKSRLKLVSLEEKLHPMIRVTYILPELLEKYPDCKEELTATLLGKNSSLFQFINTHVTAYIEKGIKPPEKIEATILNICEDISVGREIVIKTGDYIALQNFMRK
jgi:hypothetical protein